MKRSAWQTSGLVRGHLPTALGRLSFTLALLAPLILGTARPAEAIAYGGWNARISLDSWYDDNITRGFAVSPATLPFGNQDLGLNMGLSAGNVFLLTADIDTWIIASVHGRMGFLSTTPGGAWGSVFSNTVAHLDGGSEAYLLAGTTQFWGQGNYFAAEGGFIAPLWAGANARLEAGGGLYLAPAATDNTATSPSFGMPSIGLGFDQAFFSGTQVGIRYGYQTLAYSATRLDPRHQIYFLAAQKLGGGWEAHSHYLRTIDLSETAGYQEGYLDLGLGYEF